MPTSSKSPAPNSQPSANSGSVGGRPFDVVVIGAGVLGLCTAFELTRRGFSVAVLDPGGDNASSVAAGMIAPALEAVLDDATPERAALLRRAAALWPAFALDAGITLIEDVAEWRGEGADEVEARLVELGFQARRDGDRVIAVGDRRVEPELALAALSATVFRIIGTARALTATSQGFEIGYSDEVVSARKIVLATGAAAPLAGLSDLVASRVQGLTPILGRIGRTASILPPGVVRGRGGYAVSDHRQTVIGATMEVGQRDPGRDLVAEVGLLDALRGFTGAVPTSDIDWRTGVRAATVDGLPLAGASDTPGLFMALAPRRNGWLLGPMVAGVVADAIEAHAIEAHAAEGGAPCRDAAALDPLRPL